MAKRLKANYWEARHTDGFGNCDHDARFAGIRIARQRRIAVIERRLAAPALKDRSWYRVTEIVAHSVLDGNSQDRDQLFMSFASSLQAGIFDGGKRCRSQIFFAQPEPQFGLRLTDEFLTNRLKIFEADHPDKMLQRLLACCWIPRNYAVPWLRRTKSRIPDWLVAEAVALQSRGTDNLAEKAMIRKVSRAPHPPPPIHGVGCSRSVTTVTGGSYEWFERHFPGLPRPIVAAAISINDGTGSPLDAAKILRDLRASPHILSRIFSLPLSELAHQTCSLINLEDEPFRMIVNGSIPLNYATIVGGVVSHDGKLQSDLFTLLKENKPKDECTESIVRKAIEDWAEAASLDLKRKHAERTFEDPFWSAGAVLSWIAYRDRKLICRFERHRDWGTAQMYKPNGPTLKVDDPATELIRALQDGRLAASKQTGFDLPVDLLPKFWARMTIRKVFAIDPIFERAEALELWKAEPVESAQTNARLARGRGRRAALRPRIVTQMKRDIENGKWSLDDLREMTQESLAVAYGAKSRETVVLALKEVLSGSVGK